MSRARRGTVMVIQRGDAEITGAIVAGMMAARGRTPAEAGTSSVPPAAVHLTLAGSLGPAAPQRGRLLEGRSATPKGEGHGAGASGRLTGEQIEVVEAEIDRQKILADLVRVAVNNGNTPEDYRIMSVKARGDYGRLYRTPGPARRFARLLLGVYRLAVLMIAGAYRAQDRVLEG